MNGEFKNKVAVVTGGAFGIGRATAAAFARDGATVVVSDTADGGGETTVTMIRQAGGNARCVPCDVSNRAQVKAMIDGTVQQFGRIDFAFNNAGIEGVMAPTGQMPDEVWDKVIAVNLTAQFTCMKHELLQMEKQGSGVIVNNASILGTVGMAGAPAYVAAKHGLIGLTKAAAIEYATKGIRVNAVCPGFIVTPMLERAGLTTNPDARKGLESLHAMKRLGTPEEIAEAVVFMCSTRASFITGASLLVDGGYVIQ